MTETDNHNLTPGDKPDNLSLKPEAKVQTKRRTVLINRTLQFKIAIISLSLFLLAAFAVWWETYRTFTNLSASGMFEGNGGNIMPVISGLSQAIFIKISLFLALVWVLTIALSHYVAGPLFRFEATLRSLREGDLRQRIKLRRFDQLKGTANEFNATLERLHEIVLHDRKRIEEIKGTLEDLMKKADKETAEEISWVISELEKIGGAFKV